MENLQILELEENFDVEEFKKYMDTLQHLPIYPKGLENLEDTGRYPQ